MRYLALSLVVLLVAAPAYARKHDSAQKAEETFVPGSRIEITAHNAYPDHGKYTDRLDEALASGTPLMIEEDLAWVNGRSLLIHGPKNATPSDSDPTLDSYFFPKVRPLMEKALAEGDKKSWPLIILYLDIKNDPVEHLDAISKMLEPYDAWLTTAVKTDDIHKQSPLRLGPMMVVVEDKQNDFNKQEVFYDEVPVGGEIRVFGSVPKLDPNPGHKMSKDEAIDRQYDAKPDDLIIARADNYHRWIGFDWAFIEKGGETKAGDWTAVDQARLDEFVQYGHEMGYFVGFYCLDGYSAAGNQGWEGEYNFGSREAAEIRWKAAVQAHADFISSDHYKALAKFIHSPQEKMAAVR
jgi:hypothetical protein